MSADIIHNWLRTQTLELVTTVFDGDPLIGIVQGSGSVTFGFDMLPADARAMASRLNALADETEAQAAAKCLAARKG